LLFYFYFIKILPFIFKDPALSSSNELERI
jgi:hypothetical protein